LSNLLEIFAEFSGILAIGGNGVGRISGEISRRHEKAAKNTRENGTGKRPFFEKK